MVTLHGIDCMFYFQQFLLTIYTYVLTVIMVVTCMGHYCCIIPVVFAPVLLVKFVVKGQVQKVDWHIFTKSHFLLVYLIYNIWT